MTTTSPCAHFLRHMLTQRSKAFLHHPRVEPFLDQPQDAGGSDAMLHELDQPIRVRLVLESQDDIDS